jgi:toxin ParE1/3/4
MKGIVRRRDRAKQDLIDIYRYLAREAGFRTASRFFIQAEATFKQLARMPGMGSRYDPENPAFGGIRFFTISRFNKYLVFYLPTSQGVDIIRVLHGSRDIDRILAEEFGIDLEDNDSEN